MHPYFSDYMLLFRNRHMLSKAFDLFDHSFASARARFDVAVRWHERHTTANQSTVHAYARSLTLLHRCLNILSTGSNVSLLLCQRRSLMPLPPPWTKESSCLQSNYCSKPEGEPCYGQNCEVMGIRSTNFAPLVKSLSTNPKP